MRRGLWLGSWILVACGAPTNNDASGGGGGAATSIELVGDWITPWAAETITETKWQTATIVSFDNQANVAITQMPEDDEFNPSLFSRVVWTEPANEVFFYCTETFGHDSQEAAEAADDQADHDDLDAGCGGFGWTRMQRPIAISGNWSSQFGSEVISASSWDNGYAVSAISQWDNGGRWAIVLAPEDAEFNPNTYSIVHWLQPDNDTLYHCTSHYGEATADGLDPALRPNDSDPDNGGCGDFPWTKLERD